MGGCPAFLDPKMLIANATTCSLGYYTRHHCLLRRWLTWSVDASCDASSGGDAYASSSTSSASWLWTSSMGWTCGHQHHRGEAPGAGWTPSGCCSPEGYPM